MSDDRRIIGPLPPHGRSAEEVEALLEAARHDVRRTGGRDLLVTLVALLLFCGVAVFGRDHVATEWRAGLTIVVFGWLLYRMFRCSPLDRQLARMGGRGRGRPRAG